MTKRATETTTLQKALKFISLPETKLLEKDYCLLRNGCAIASNGILTACHPIEEEIDVRPNIKLLISALNNCGKNINITQLDDNKLSIKSLKFLAYVPCYPETISHTLPDNPLVDISDVLKEGFKSIGHLTQEVGETVYHSSILLKSMSMFATNGAILMEYWHGINIPTIKIPKSFANIIMRSDKPLSKMGFSDNSVTFWFADNSWIKTQLFIDEWPNVDGILDCPGEPVETPKKLFENLHSLTDFSEHDIVYMNDIGMRTSKAECNGAVYTMSGLGAGSFLISNFKMLDGRCNSLYFSDNKVWFFGNNLRGVIVGVSDI